MRRSPILRSKQDSLINDLKETTLSFQKLGEKYGVSRQAVHGFCKRRGIKRPERPKGHQTERCRLCQKLIQISKKPHSEFISHHTIVKKTGGVWSQYIPHLRALRKAGLVKPKFGRLHSKRAERAFAIYLTKPLSICKIGRMFHYKNFCSAVRRYRETGWNIPPSLYVYDAQERGRIRSENHRRKKEQER